MGDLLPTLPLSSGCIVAMKCAVGSAPALQYCTIQEPAPLVRRGNDVAVGVGLAAMLLAVVTVYAGIGTDAAVSATLAATQPVTGMTAHSSVWALPQWHEHAAVGGRAPVAHPYAPQPLGAARVTIFDRPLGPAGAVSRQPVGLVLALACAAGALLGAVWRSAMSATAGGHRTYATTSAGTAEVDFLIALPTADPRHMHAHATQGRPHTCAGLQRRPHEVLPPPPPQSLLPSSNSVLSSSPTLTPIDGPVVLAAKTRQRSKEHSELGLVEPRSVRVK